MLSTNKLLLVFLLVILFTTGCNDDEELAPIDIVSSSINGYAFNADLNNISIDLLIPIDLLVEVTMSKVLSKESLEKAISLSSSDGAIDFELSLVNANSKIIIEADLEYLTDYTLTISQAVIGQNGESLTNDLTVNFTTMENDIIHSMAPCTNTINCMQPVTLSQNGSEALFWVYANYPIEGVNARWDDLTQAVIVVHGQNRDADNYYQYLTASLQGMNLSANTLLIAPWFKNEADADAEDLYWSTSAWREGGTSSGALTLSSYAVVDSLIAALANSALFPTMQRVIVTGHSSGGMFTHTYAAANNIDHEGMKPSLDYVVANSQYFYYPSDMRLDEATGTFVTPIDCPGYNSWPFGFTNHPAYINLSDHDAYNNRLAGRAITYLLGNDTSNDTPLNTTNCHATLLGSTRYQRGENMFAFMNEFFPGNRHERVIVESIGHNGQLMYASDAFESLLIELINQ